MKFNSARGLLILAATLALSLASAACRPDTAQEDARLKKVETSLTQLGGVTAKVKELESKDDGLAGQLAGIQSALTEVQAQADDFQNQAGDAKSTAAEMKKKADDLSARVAALSTKVDSFSGRIGAAEQKASLLQTRYDDHLRKYHSGG